MTLSLSGMDTPRPAPPASAPHLDAGLRYANDVISQAFEAAAQLDKDRSPHPATSVLRLANLRELAFDVAVAQDGLRRDGAVQDAHSAMRLEALQGLEDAKTVLLRLIEAEGAFADRIAAARPESAARRA